MVMFHKSNLALDNCFCPGALTVFTEQSTSGLYVCLPGYFNTNPMLCLGSATCTPCPVNTYSPVSGATACFPCSAGIFSSRSNAFSPTASTTCYCLSGWILAGTSGDFKCNICPENTYAIGINSLSCLPCPAGSASSPGSTSCDGYQASAPWPAHGRFPNARNMTSPFNPGAMSGYVVWTYQTGGGIGYSSPVIGADGTIYIGSSDGSLNAITSTGALKWVYYTALSLSSQTPAISANGNIYVYSNDNYLYSISSSGAFQWMAGYGNMKNYGCGDGCDSGVNVPGIQLSWPSPVIGPDGTIYLSAWSQNTIWAIRSTGSAIWSTGTTGWNLYTPALVKGVLFVSGQEWLYAFTSSGSFIWVRYEPRLYIPFLNLTCILCDRDTGGLVPVTLLQP